MDIASTTSIRSANSNDFRRVIELLQSENLPVEDIPKDLAHFFVIDVGDDIVAAVGLEIYEKNALLRSMIVDKEHRSRTLAEILLDKLFFYAAEQGVTYLYLITTTAEKYFERKGFTIIDREKVPSLIAASREFSILCPSTATVMKKEL